MFKGTAFDKLMFRTAYLYISIPFIIFVAGWLRWFYSIPVIAIITLATIFSIRQHKEFISIDLYKHRLTISLCLVALFVWILLSGIGGFSFQNDDHYARNAVLKDLVEHPWPLVYDFTYWQPYGVTEPGHYMLVYYIGYWMPAALAGKLFGLQAAHGFLFCWTFIGVSLSFYFICRFLRKIKLWVALLFILFSGMDIVPVIFQWNYHPLYHLEWWHNNFQQYSSNTSLLYWVFNQTIVPWLIVAMLVNKLPRANIAFITSLCFFFAPFPFIGLLPIAAYFSFSNNTEKFKQLFSFQNTIAALVILLIMLGFYSSNSTGEGFNLHMTSFGDTLSFYAVEFLLVSLLVFAGTRRKSLLFIIILCLCIFPFLQYRHTADFTMRASIPALFLLMILAAEQISVQKNSWIKFAIITLLVIGSVTAINEMTRSVYMTGKYWYYKKIRHQQPDFDLLQKPNLFRGNNTVIVIMVGDVSKSLFYKTLCK